MDWKSNSIPTWGCFVVAVATGALMVIWRIHDKGGSLSLGGWSNNLSIFFPTLLIAGAVVGSAILNYKAQPRSSASATGMWKPAWQKLQWCNAERERLEKEIQQLKASQPKPSQYPIPQLRYKIVVTVSELQGFLGEHGNEPVITRLTGESTRERALRYLTEGQPWKAKFIGDYRLKFGDSLPKLRDEMRARTSVSDNELNRALETAADDEENSAKAVNAIVERLWALALNVNA